MKKESERIFLLTNCGTGRILAAFSSLKKAKQALAKMSVLFPDKEFIIDVEILLDPKDEQLEREI